MRIVIEQRRRTVTMLALFIAVLLAALMLGLGSSDDRAIAQTTKGVCKPGLISSWGASPVATGDTTAPPITFEDQTIRNIVHTNAGGKEVRIRLSNEFGDAPITFDSVFIGRGQPDSAAIKPGTNKRLTFGGKRSVTIQPGKSVNSDLAQFEVNRLEDLAISFHLPNLTGPEVTQHPNAQQVNYVASGDRSSDTSGTAFTPSGETWYFLTDVDVEVERKTSNVVALGDSITDGLQSTPNKNNRYPDYLAERMKAKENTRFLTVENQGIAGNRLLRDNIGPSVLHRLEPDVFSQPGVSDIILLVGINDIANPPFIGRPGQEADSADIIRGYKEVIRRAHARDLKIFAATILPGGDATDPAQPPFTTYSTRQVNAERVEVNRFIRTSGAFDGFFDFDKAIRDPNNPEAIKFEFESRIDGFHPNDAGYKRLAQEVDLSVFSKGRCR